MGTKCMTLALALIIALFGANLFAQGNGTVRGVIRSTDGAPVALVSVRVVDTRYGAVSGHDGAFELSIPAGIYRLEVSHVGYKKMTKEITVNAGSSVSADFELTPSIFTMEQVVVTGSRGAEVSVRKLPASVVVISSEEMAMKNVRTIDDALQEIPGVVLGRSQGLNSSGGHASVSMRGTVDSDRTLVLKDGIPLNSSYTGGVSVWNTTSSCAVNRIEVVKGAASALYGSSAMGGVINLITDTPTLTPKFSARTEFGSKGSSVAAFKYSQAFANKLGVMFTGEYKKTDGYQYRADESWKDYYINPSNEVFTISTKLEYTIRPGSKIRFDYEHHNENPYSGTSTRYNSRYEENRFVARYDGLSGVFNYSGALFAHRRTDKYHAMKYSSSTGGFTRAYYDGDIPKNETGFLGHLSSRIKNHILTLGTDIKLGSTESDYDYVASGQRYFEGKQMTYSLYLNDEISLGKYVDLSLGVRYDSWTNKEGTFYDHNSGEPVTLNYPETSDNRVSPKAGVVFHINDNARLRTSYSTGFKSPSLYYLYRSAPHGSTKFNLANPDLKPEIMNRSVDVGGDFLIANRLEMSLTYYNSNFEDFMYNVTVDEAGVPSYLSPGDGMVVLQNVNIGKVNLYGFEAAFKYAIDECWNASLSYNYNKSEIMEHDIDASIIGNELEDSPNHHLKIGLNYSNPRIITAGIWMRTTGSQFSDEENTDENRVAGYTTFDIKLSREIVSNVSLSAEVYNLFDKQYYSYWSSASSYYYGPPRMVYVGLNYAY